MLCRFYCRLDVFLNKAFQPERYQRVRQGTRSKTVPHERKLAILVIDAENWHNSHCEESPYDEAVK